jgi:hypothetical protein
MVFRLFLAAAGLAAAAPALAGPPPAGERYAIERTADGFVRLDRTTGEMSYCRLEGAANLVCRLAADERAAYESKISALTNQIGAGAPSNRQTLEEKKTDAAGEISLVEFILKRMIHSMREVADTASQAKLTPPAKSP